MKRKLKQSNCSSFQLENLAILTAHEKTKQMMEREIFECKIHVTFEDSFPQTSLLTGCKVIPIVPVESLSFLILLSKQFHGGFVICLLLRALSCGIFNVLVESSLGLLCPILDVADSDVDDVYPLREVTITTA